MDDIVTRLRHWASPDPDNPQVNELHRAADEIERLHEQCDYIKAHIEILLRECRESEAEIGRLRALIDSQDARAYREIERLYFKMRDDRDRYRLIFEKEMKQSDDAIYELHSALKELHELRKANEIFSKTASLFIDAHDAYCKGGDHDTMVYALSELRQLLKNSDKRPSNRQNRQDLQ